MCMSFRCVASREEKTQLFYFQAEEQYTPSSLPSRRNNWNSLFKVPLYSLITCDSIFPSLSIFRDKKDCDEREPWEPTVYLPIKGDGCIVWSKIMAFEKLCRDVERWKDKKSVNGLHEALLVSLSPWHNNASAEGVWNLRHRHFINIHMTL